MSRVTPPGKPEGKKSSQEPLGRLGDHTVKPIKSRRGIFGWITNLFSRFLSIFRKSPPPPSPGYPVPGAPPLDVSRDPSLKTPSSSPEASLDPSRRASPPPSPKVSRAATPPLEQTDWAQLIEGAQNKRYLPFIEACRNDPPEGKRTAKSQLEDKMSAVFETKDQKSLQTLANESKLGELPGSFAKASQTLRNKIAEKREELLRQSDAFRQNLEREVESINQLNENVERYKKGKAPFDRYLAAEDPEAKIVELSKSIASLNEILDVKKEELDKQTFVSTKKKSLSKEIDNLNKSITAAETQLQEAQMSRQKRVEQEKARDEWQGKINYCHAEMQPHLERQNKIIEEDRKINDELALLARLEGAVLQLGKLDPEQTEALFSAWTLHELAEHHVKVSDQPMAIWERFAKRPTLMKDFETFLSGHGLTPANSVRQLINNLLIIQS